MTSAQKDCAKASLEALQALRMRLSSPPYGQQHLFAGWPGQMSECSDHQVKFMTELHDFAKSYPGGVERYIRNGQQLLDADRKAKESTASSIAFKELKMPSLLFNAPSSTTVTPELTALETTGAALVKKCVFVLVAGGLGERLGFSGIKVGLPVETATMRSYLEHYFGWVKAAAGADAPFVIMTSNDTHSRTVELIEVLQPGMPNLRLLKQETVFCFADATGRLAVSKEGNLLRKPHGHGDVHSLIYAAKASEGSTQSLMDSWRAKGYEHIAFFQDTNAPATLTIPLSLAISERERLDMNFTCIPREPKEAIGLLCHTLRAKNGDGGSGPQYVWKTSIVEYNVFEQVASAITTAGGDVAAPGSQYSAYPGSINTLLFNLGTYAELLASSEGSVPEFINPKYADASCTGFKKPARIESLMQDFALLFSDDKHRVGGTVFGRDLYQPVKNALADACDKVRQNMTPHCPTSGEEEFYSLMRRRLRALGVQFEDDGPESDVVVGGVMKTKLFPIVTLNAASTLGGADVGIGGMSDLAKLFPQPHLVRISDGSTLLVEGKVIIESLELRGAVRIVGPSLESGEAPLVVRDLKVNNMRWNVRETTGSDTQEVDRIRGFILVKTVPQVFDKTSKL